MGCGLWGVGFMLQGIGCEDSDFGFGVWAIGGAGDVYASRGTRKNSCSSPMFDCTPSVENLCQGSRFRCSRFRV